jgi:TolB-like protein
MFERSTSSSLGARPWLAVLPVPIDSLDFYALTSACQLLCGLNAKLATTSAWFSVVNRSAMALLNHEQLSDLEISERLGAQYLLWGELSCATGSFGWSFELVDAKSDNVLWSDVGVLEVLAPPETIDQLVLEIARKISGFLLDDWRRVMNKK